ncbi:MAG: DsbA family protein [Patescibacteria group bacterium]|jgi:protein-disulfide isomerase|nr:thioredoxin domain-containing protein [bacterium]HQC49850.1 thioredoxin domain-containing protein [bacterium]
MSLEERIKYAEMKSRHRKKLTPWYKKWWGKIMITVFFLTAIFLVAASIYVFIEANRINEGKSTRFLEEQREKYLAAINRNSANTYGPTNAKVTIVIFSDFACPFCRDSHEGLKNIREKYGDQVKIVYRDYPLHDNSIFLALSARCAGEQGKFWQMHDLFFDNFDQFSDKSQSELEIVMPEIASLLEIDATRFSSCIRNQRHFPQIKQDYEDGSFLDIEGTPTWFINNNRLIGSITKKNLESLITDLLHNITK